MHKNAAFKLESVLLPVDFSEANLKAARQAGILARRFNATVTLLHVHELPNLFLSWPVIPGSTSVPELSRRQLEAFGAAELCGAVVKRVTMSGDPATVIVNCADHIGCDLIIMPAHGHGPVRRFLLGSVTAKVLDTAKCPVWTVTGSTDQSDPHAIRQILCGVKLDPQSASIIRWAAAFADMFDAALTVVSILPTAPPSDVPERYVSEWNQDALPGLESRLRELVEESGARANVQVDQGHAATTLANIARSKVADLLVIGRRSGEGLGGRLGRNTYEIVRLGPCPVVSV